MNKNKVTAPIPVTIIGGFLGAGKTTLLNDILTGSHGVRAGVLVNDFGAINIDAQLVVGVEQDDTINLANGCICCNIREDLIAACLLMLQRPEPPEVLLIETSGVSDPFQVANSFVNPDYHGAFLLNTILTVVDADNFSQLKGEMASLAIKQIEIADFLVLNKADLVGEEKLATTKEVIKKIAPKSRVLETSYCKIPLELVLSNTNEIKSFDLPVMSAPLPDLPASHISTAHTHNHPFTTWSWTSDEKLSLPKLREVLDNLSENIYRAKGILYIEELPVYRVVMQLVGGRYDVGETDKWGSEKPKTELVFIGANNSFDIKQLMDDLEACIGTGDDANSPILRLVKKIAPELLAEK